MPHHPWPVLRSFDRDRLYRLAMPIGGIGTGCVSLAGRGHLRDFEIVNRPAKGFRPDHTMFALHVAEPNGRKITRVLEGPLDPAEYEGADGSRAANHGLPRFRECAFHAAYPFGQVVLSDEDVPVTARLEAFNPLVPGDAEISGLPVAIVRVRLINRTNVSLSAGVAATLLNFIGTDGTQGQQSKNLNELRAGDGFTGLWMRSEGVAPTAAGWGTMALVTPGTRHTITHRATWPALNWGGGLLGFWDDFSEDGKLDGTTATPNDYPTGAIAASFALPPRGEETVTFLFAWHFPNRMSWTPGGQGKWVGNGACESGEPIIGNYYTTKFRDAWEVAEKVVPRLAEYEQKTLDFVEAFCASDLPEIVKEAALSNVSTLRSPTVFRTPDGKLYGWEGVFDRNGSCFGSCTHVWNYEQTTPFFFGDLTRTMRDVEFLHATGDSGHMNFRTRLPLEFARGENLAAADGQMGCLIKLYRDWQLSGDDTWLKSLWPRAKKSLEFCWVDGGWDSDRDGVMEGCQHNTMDVEYYGPNPQMQGWYLGALRAAAEMARYLGDAAFADHCNALFEKGSVWMDAHLFNGEYYEHQVWPPKPGQHVADGIRHPSMGARDQSDPDLQLGPGCLIDQLVGQYMAHLCGLGYLHDRDRVRTTLHSIVKHNRQVGFHDHFNNMRSYVLGDETALLMATYPRGGRPRRPFPYHSEVMTGFEYTAAVGLMCEGDTEEGLRIIADIRARYDGQKRSPFDEAECGHHYARAMASWAAVLALTGFHYSAVTETITFAASDREVTWFWSNGSAWGTVRQADGQVTLSVRGGPLRVKTLRLVSPATGAAAEATREGGPIAAGEMWKASPRTAD